jgi:hypothetical protein
MTKFTGEKFNSISKEDQNLNNGQDIVVLATNGSAGNGKS